MKKLKKTIILIITAATLGFSASFLRHNFYLDKLKDGFTNIHFLVYLPLIIAIIFFIILIHELGHLFYFVFKGIKIKALFIFIFVLIKDKGWKLKVRFKNAKLIGGFVVPNIPDIKTDEEYDNFKKIFRRALIVGPIVSNVYFLVTVILFVSFWFFTNLNTLTSYLLINFVVTLLITIVINLSSNISTDNVFGDYKAYEKFKEDKFSTMQIIQYYNFKDKTNEETDEYLFSRLIDLFEKNIATYNMFDIVLVSYLIMYSLKLNRSSDVIDKTIKNYNLNSLARNKYGYELVYLISSYYYFINDLDRAFEILEMNKNTQNSHVDEKKRNLLKLEYEHYLNTKDNEKEIYEYRDYLITELDLLIDLFDVDKQLSDMVKTLEFKEYKTELLTFLDN